MILETSEARCNRKDLPLISKFSFVVFGIDQVSLVRQRYGYKLRGSSLENYTDNEAAVKKDILYT